MFVVTYRKIFFIISALLILISIGAMVVYGFNFGIDFKGGTITQVSYMTTTGPLVTAPTATSTPAAVSRPDQESVKAELNKLGLGNYVLQPTGELGFVLRTVELNEQQKQQVLNALSLNGSRQITLENYNSIGPVVGNELKRKAVTSIALVVLGIVLFVTYAFRKVSEPVASWKYGVATIIALIHDVIIPTGFYIIYSRYFGGEIDVLFVSAILAILGYSVHDTIVVFDRVREHLRINREERNKENFETTVGKSVSETFGRSINTSLTIFLVLLALYIFGGEPTRHFAIVLLMGVIVGTYSSIFVASPLLVTLEKLQIKKSAK
ncbi:MAG: protein translocase subunit SecF [bacterium]|nr:protein translocase subunit SecF [bacterium]